MMKIGYQPITGNTAWEKALATFASGATSESQVVGRDEEMNGKRDKNKACR